MKYKGEIKNIVIEEIQRKIDETKQRIRHINEKGMVASCEDQFLVYLEKLLSFVINIKEEPASKVWHDARFKPYPDSHIVVVLQNGHVSNYTYTDCYNGEFWLKNDISHLRLKVVKWAYVDELLNY